MSDKAFSEEQKQYLAGFAYGADVARAMSGLPIISGSGAEGASITIGGQKADSRSKQESIPAGPEKVAYEAQNTLIASGKKLCKEEAAKQAKNPLDMWDEIAARSAEGKFPKGTDVFLTKFHGLFYVAPAQDSYMCRLRLPGGEIFGYQLEGLADLADECAGGFLDITTRANLQLREIPAAKAMNVLYGLRELGIVNLGSGGDNIRNVTASPLSGIDVNELIETLPLAKRMHHYILNHREMYGLPRKFNIAFDGGGTVASLDDTNDIGFHAVSVDEQSATEDTPAGIYFQLTLGGITGHQDFARPTGILFTPDETIDVAGAIVKVFIQNGDRTDRKKARLKYVLDEWGFEKFIQAIEAQMGRPLRKIPTNSCRQNYVEDRFAHVGIHEQAQEGLKYVGIVFPVGRMTSDQARGLAGISRKYGNGQMRLTVWQNLIIPNIKTSDLELVQSEVKELGLEYSASSLRAGLVACTGNAGCKFAGANTKKHALELAEYLENRLTLETPINIHVTGCHHSCAQHYIGDIGLIATKVEVGEDLVEGYDVYVGGGWGPHQAIGRLIFKALAAEDVGSNLESLLLQFIEQRKSPQETFCEYTARTSDEVLRSVQLVSA